MINIYLLFNQIEESLCKIKIMVLKIYEMHHCYSYLGPLGLLVLALYETN